jgi:hypothetical protein
MEDLAKAIAKEQKPSDFDGRTWTLEEHEAARQQQALEHARADAIGDDLLIAIPKEVQQYKNDIRRFVDAMVFKLRKHANKGRWEGGNISQYVIKLHGEVAELEVAVSERNTMEIMAEAADVANYAMIINSMAVENGQ